MHRLLTVSDIVSQICDILIDDDRDRASVSRLARTNKILSVPCFARLWRTLDCLYPLLNALPSSIVDLKSRWRLLRYPTLVDWNRPLYYGVFVRSISYDPQPSGVHRSLFYDIISSLHIRSGAGPSPGATILLPNLTYASITWRLSSPESFLAYNLFHWSTLLSSSLICKCDPLNALEHQHRAIMAEWLASLQNRCPLLEGIHYYGRWGAIMAIRPVSHVDSTMPYYPNLRALTTVLTSEYANRFIRASAAQPRLKHMSVKFDPVAVMPDSLPQDSFPSLEKLEVGGYNQKCSEFLSLLAPSPPPNLASLSLTCLSLEQPTSAFFRTVAHAAPHLTLRSLSLTFHPNYDSAARTTLADLTPLFIFEELRELRIQAGNPWHLSSAALETIGAAFPQLGVLCLNSPRVEEGGDEVDASFSWSAVTSLAKTCPLLTELSLPLDYESLPSISPTPSPRSSTYSYSGKPSFDDPSPLSSPLPRFSQSISPSHTEEATFPNLDKFILNDLPLTLHPITSPLSTPLPAHNHAPSTSAALASALLSLRTLPRSLSSSSASPSPAPTTRRSRSARNSLHSPQYAALAILVERIFPRAKLGLHISWFDQHEEQLRRERFETMRSTGSSRRQRRKIR